MFHSQLPSEHQIGPNIFKAAIVMAGQKLQCDQNSTIATKDEVLEQKEDIPDQPSQEEMRSRFIQFNNKKWKVNLSKLKNIKLSSQLGLVASRLYRNINCL